MELLWVSFDYDVHDFTCNGNGFSGLNPAALIMSPKLSTNLEKSLGVFSSGICFSVVPRANTSPISRLIRRRRSGFSAMSGAIFSNPSIATSNCSTIALICAARRSRRQSIWSDLYVRSWVAVDHAWSKALFTCISNNIRYFSTPNVSSPIGDRKRQYSRVASNRNTSNAFSGDPRRRAECNKNTDLQNSSTSCSWFRVGIMTVQAKRSSRSHQLEYRPHSIFSANKSRPFILDKNQNLSLRKTLAASL